MSPKKVTLVYSLNNTFVLKDIALLERMGHKVMSIQSPPHKDVFRFTWNRIKEFFLGFFLVVKSEAVWSWFNDYHTFAIFFWAKFLNKQRIIIVGGYDAVSCPKLNYGIFLKENLRQFLARWNYKQANQIWVVHQSLAKGCVNAREQDGTQSGIQNFIPEVALSIREVPTAYDPTFWKKEGEKNEKGILTVANISDERTYLRKGIPLFIKLAERLPEYQFTIVGIQNPSANQRELPKNIKLVGTLDRVALKKQYSQHQFYVQGSKVEGLPNGLCEAMLCECIPIGTNVFGIPEAIGSTGYILDATDNLESLTSFIKAIEDPIFLGKQARKRIKNQYPISRREKAFKNVLNLEKGEK